MSSELPKKKSLVKSLEMRLLHFQVIRILVFSAITICSFENQLNADIISEATYLSGPLCPKNRENFLSLKMKERIDDYGRSFLYAQQSGVCGFGISEPPRGIHGVTFNYQSDFGFKNKVTLTVLIDCLGDYSPKRTRTVSMDPTPDTLKTITVFSDPAGLTCPNNEKVILSITALLKNPPYPNEPNRNIRIQNLYFF